MYAYPVPVVTMPSHQVLVQHQDEEESAPKSVEQIIAEEAQHLDTPQESVEFLQYMMKHAEKVNLSQKRLQSFSRSLMAAGCLVAGYAAMCYASKNETTAPNGRLQATHQSSSE